MIGDGRLIQLIGYGAQDIYWSDYTPEELAKDAEMERVYSELIQMADADLESKENLNDRMLIDHRDLNQPLDDDDFMLLLSQVDQNGWFLVL